jgi:hypothetical protein
LKLSKNYAFTGSIKSTIKLCKNRGLGVWFIGRAFASHGQGPGFGPQHLKKKIEVLGLTELKRKTGLR